MIGDVPGSHTRTRGAPEGDSQRNPGIFPMTRPLDRRIIPIRFFRVTDHVIETLPQGKEEGMSHRVPGTFLCVAVMLVGLAPSPAMQAAETERVIIQCEGPCGPVVAAIEAMGGEITYRYANVDALAATILKTRRPQLLALGGIKGIRQDLLITLPNPKVTEVLPVPDAQMITGAALDALVAELPDNYSFNNGLTGAGALHRAGETGDGVIVAVIDSGVVNLPGHALTGKVIGGENFVPGPSEPSATSSRNGSHGSWVGSMIAADAAFLFSDAGRLGPSLQFHAPRSIIPCDGRVCPFGLNIVPMVGTAPDADLYALKVFSAFGGGAPFSRVTAAMDRAITLRRNFNNGMPSVPFAGSGSEEDPFVFDSLNIEVVNMSLSGPTLFAANEVDELLTLEMLDVGITIVNSAGNNGHAAMTGGGAGTGRGTLTTAAASSVAHERILRDLESGLGVGILFRPANHHQTATFSSRGPSADGRFSTDVTANGFASFVHGVGPCCSIVSGTSFSSPTVAGAAALLRGAVPSASAVEVRNALVATANPAVLGDNSGPIDQGAGFIDVPAALALLQSGGIDTNLPRGPEGAKVRGNIAHLGLQIVEVDKSGRFSTSVENLMPGQVAHFFVVSHKDTDRLTVTLQNITPELPPARQNSFFGDDIFLQIVDAQTSFEVPFFRDPIFLFSDTTIDLDKPQTGLVRLAVMGDWTNAGRISTDLVIEEVRTRRGPKTAKGKVEQDGVDELRVRVPAGTTQILFDLSWTNNWGAYPVDDIDLILFDPSDNPNFAGATLDSPERVVINDPAPGLWTIWVTGFTVQAIHGGEESKWELRARDQDGKTLKKFKAAGGKKKKDKKK